MAFLDNTEPAWKQENHPEIAAEGVAGWVRSQRQRSSTRQLRVESWAEENNL
jgi:hypothetical protein